MEGALPWVISLDERFSFIDQLIWLLSNQSGAISKEQESNGMGHDITRNCPLRRGWIRKRRREIKAQEQDPGTILVIHWNNPNKLSVSVLLYRLTTTMTTTLWGSQIWSNGVIIFSGSPSSSFSSGGSKHYVECFIAGATYSCASRVRMYKDVFLLSCHTIRDLGGE